MKQLCFNWFRPGHRSEDCSGYRCKEFGQKHNTLLHCDQKNFVKQSDTATQQISAKVKTDDKMFIGSATHEKSQDEVFLQGAIIPLEINGEIFLVRGVFDSASHSNLVAETAVQRLQIRRKKQKTRLCGQQGTSSSTHSALRHWTDLNNSINYSAANQPFAFETNQHRRLDKTEGIKIGRSPIQRHDHWSSTIRGSDDWKQQNQGADRFNLISTVKF